MSASAEEVSASIQTVAGTTAQQGAAVEELVASSQELAGVARELEDADRPVPHPPRRDMRPGG